MLHSIQKSQPGKDSKISYQTSCYLRRKGVFEAEFLQSWAKFKKGVDVKGRDRQVK